MIFDLRKEVPWAEKLTTEEVKVDGHKIWVVGCGRLFHTCLAVRIHA